MVESGVILTVIHEICVKVVIRMLGGEYYHSLDQKGRLIIPSRLRDELGERFLITCWMDDCLAIFTEEEMTAIVERMKEKASLSRSRSIQRYLFSNSTTVEPDKQGRIVIPQKLRDKVQLGTEVVIVGVYDRVEIWNKDEWETRSEQDKEAFDENMLELDI